MSKRRKISVPRILLPSAPQIVAVARAARAGPRERKCAKAWCAADYHGDPRARGGAHAVSVPPSGTSLPPPLGLSASLSLSPSLSRARARCERDPDLILFSVFLPICVISVVSGTPEGGGDVSQGSGSEPRVRYRAHQCFAGAGPRPRCAAGRRGRLQELRQVPLGESHARKAGGVTPTE